MKSLFTSKTFWFNVLTAAAAIFALPEVTSFIDPQKLLIAQAVINIVLRLFTSKGVTVTGTGTGG